MQQSLTVAGARQDMRTAYLGGAPGLFVSGTVWMGAARRKARK